MNIFHVHGDPKLAAQSLVDKHVVKMILESAQLLSTAHRVLDGIQEIESKYVEGSLPPRYRKVKVWKLNDARENVLYKATHINHPSAIWCRQSIGNYDWLVEHFFALCEEYTYRYEKKHKCYDMGYMLQSPPHNLKEYEPTPFVCAMPDQYKISYDPVENYREYYRVAKKDLHKWTKREEPGWISGVTNCM